MKHSYKLATKAGTVTAQVVREGDLVEIGVFGEGHYLARIFKPEDAIRFAVMIVDVARQIQSGGETDGKTDGGTAQEAD